MAGYDIGVEAGGPAHEYPHLSCSGNAQQLHYQNRYVTVLEG